MSGRSVSAHRCAFRAISRSVGPAGSVTLGCGVITARRHIHMNPAEAEQLGLRNAQSVSVKVDSDGRDLTFNDVIVRVRPDFRLELHLDTDEANAAGVTNGDFGEIESGTGELRN